MSIPSLLSPFDHFSGSVRDPATSSAQVAENTARNQRNPRALDVFCITTRDTAFQEISEKLKIQARTSGVPMEVLYVEMLEGDTKNEKIAELRAYLHQLHQHGKIDEATQIIVHLHGSCGSGPHYMAGIRDIFCIDTRDLVSLIRESKNQPSGASEVDRWNGTIHISACGVGAAAKAVSNDGGLTLLYGGSKAKLTIDSEDIFFELIRQLGEYRKDPEKNTFPTAQQFYITAGSISGEKVSLSGDGQLCQIRSKFSPPASDLLLPSVKTKLEKSLVAKLMHGKTHTFEEVVRLLGVAVQHIKFASPLQVLVISAPNDAEEKLKILLEAGVNINQATTPGKTALHFAIGEKQDVIARLLLKYGADINRADARGDSPLGLALRTRQFDMAEYLIGAGADMRSVTGSKESALHLAVLFENVRLVKQLLDKSADPLAEDDIKDSPLQRALKANRFDLVELMLPHVPPTANPSLVFDQPTLIEVLAAGQEKIFRDMLNRYPDKVGVLTDLFQSIASEIKDNKKGASFNIKIFEKHKLMIGIICNELFERSARMLDSLKNLILSLGMSRSYHYGEFFSDLFEAQSDLLEKWSDDFEELATLLKKPG